MEQRSRAATWDDVWGLRLKVQDLLAAARKSPGNQRRVWLAEQKMRRAGKAQTPGLAAACLHEARSILAKAADTSQPSTPHRNPGPPAQRPAHDPDGGTINWNTAKRLLDTAERTFDAEAAALPREVRARARAALDRASSALNAKSAVPNQVINRLYRFHTIIGAAKKPES